MITETQTGTFFVNGIEYNEYPPPQQLCKTMEGVRASELVNSGKIRIHKLEYYRQWENPLLGDRNDGEGLYHLDGHPIQKGSTNDVYAWCLSLPEIDSKQVLAMAKCGKYDCTALIQVEKLLARMHAYLSQHNRGFLMHCGYVHYNRGAEVSKETLNSQKFHSNVFQKAPRFQADKEYRISITNCTFERHEGDYLDLLIGDCRDIISIQPIPNNSSKDTPLTSCH